MGRPKTPPVAHSITTSHHLRALVESDYGDISTRLHCDHHLLSDSGTSSKIPFSLASCSFCVWSWSLSPLLCLPALPPDLPNSKPLISLKENQLVFLHLMNC